MSDHALRRGLEGPLTVLSSKVTILPYDKIKEKNKTVAKSGPCRLLHNSAATGEEAGHTSSIHDLFHVLNVLHVFMYWLYRCIVCIDVVHTSMYLMNCCIGLVHAEHWKCSLYITYIFFSFMG